MLLLENKSVSFFIFCLDFLLSFERMMVLQLADLINTM